MRSQFTILGLGFTVLTASIWPGTAVAQPASGPSAGFTDPRAIDRAVANLTGVNIGEVGGARQPADPRLRLKACFQPLSATWHGQSKSTVMVACPDPSGWRIFISTLPKPATARAENVVKRGDPITVLVRGRGFTVQQSGEATENGAVGDWIGVRTVRRGDPVRARIERPGLAVIPSN